MRPSQLGIRRRRLVSVETRSAPPRRRRRLRPLGAVIAGPAVLLAVARDPLGRAVLIVSAVALGEVAVVKGCLFLLIPIGEFFAEAEGVGSDVRAAVATFCVLAVSTVLMFGVLVAGIIAVFTIAL